MVEKLSHLIDFHMGDLKSFDPNWCLELSNVAGRGVFAAKNIKAGEEIFREYPLLIGPTARKPTVLNTCTICYKLLEVDDFICKKGCGLPVCDPCSHTKQHSTECSLFRSWKPKDQNKAEPGVIRMLTVARGLFLNKNQKELLYEMQANVEKADMNEITNAGKHFENFPTDRSILDYFHRIISVLNTNAFESLSKKEDHDILLRGLYPLSGIMNHECTPNTCHFFERDGLIIVKATVDIKERTEITNTYTKLMWSNLMRQFFLRMTKNFQCDCSRCKDPTEGNTLLGGLLCRQQRCSGIVIPKDCSILPQWQCVICGRCTEHSKMSKYQEFALNAINLKMANSTIPEMITFLNDVAPKLCPETNYIIIEAKLSLIWKMQKKRNEYSLELQQQKLKYCDEILEILEKLKAGECTLKCLLLEEIEETKKIFK